MKTFLTLILIFTFASCKQSHVAVKKLAIKNLKYSAFYWHLNQQLDSFQFYLVHYIDIDKDGNFVIMRHDVPMDKAEYFKGSINDTVRKYIDSTFLNEKFKTDYSYMMNPNFIYDGFTYCFDYRTDNNRKEIIFIPHNSPGKIRKLSTILDSLIYSSNNEIIDTLDVSAYTIKLKQLAEKIQAPPPPPKKSKIILFKPPKRKKK